MRRRSSRPMPVDEATRLNRRLNARRLRSEAIRSRNLRPRPGRPTVLAARQPLAGRPQATAVPGHAKPDKAAYYEDPIDATVLFRPYPNVARQHIEGADGDIRHYLGRMSTACSQCGALHWLAEGSDTYGSFSSCCTRGNVTLPLASDYPPELKELLTASTVTRSGGMARAPLAEGFHRLIRHYNNSFAFASTGCDYDRTLIERRYGAYTFRIRGILCHRIGDLFPDPAHAPRFAQLYLYDDDDVQYERRQEAFQHLHGDVSRQIQDCLARVNPYYRVFKTAAERLREDGAVDLQLSILDGRLKDPRRYNVPAAAEVAALIPQDTFSGVSSRHILLRNRRSNNLSTIHEFNPMYMPLAYPLLFPRGEQGWHDSIPHTFGAVPGEAERLNAVRRPAAVVGPAVDRGPARRARARGRRRLVSPTLADDRRGLGGSSRVTLLEYFSYYLHVRPTFSPLHHAGPLFHQWLVDAFVCVETNRLNFLRRNNETWRKDYQAGLTDRLLHGADLDLSQVGQAIILPASFSSGPRSIYANYQDALAICREYGRPDIFLTFTCNPQWKEVLDELMHGERPGDRPDLIARVFHLKLLSLVRELTVDNILGEVAAWCYVVEYQKRGLPHAHILLILARRARLGPGDIDLVVSAELPDRAADPVLFNVVANQMLHGPCGIYNRASVCNDDRARCTKRYPKPYVEATSASTDSYPVYRRRDDGRRVESKGFTFTNRWVVPFNPYLCKRYNAHINVEVATGVACFKYLYKYVYKGPDRATVEVGGGRHARDEIREHVDARYVSACEACWRLFAFKTHDRYPPVFRLAIHEAGRAPIFWKASETADRLRERLARKRTHLTEYFAYNDNTARRVTAAAPALDATPDLRHVLYHDFPKHLAWLPRESCWRRRLRRATTVGRVNFVPPSAGDLFYLRLLLTTVPGFRSFDDCRTFNGALLGTYKEACLARGLLDGDEEWHRCLTEAAGWHTGVKLRSLFVLILVECRPAEPAALWQRHAVELSDDCAWRLRTSFGVAAPTADDASDLALSLTREELVRRGSTLALVGLPEPATDFLNCAAAEPNRLVQDELAYDVPSLVESIARDEPRLNVDQRSAFTALHAAVDSGRGGMFFIDGPGGTGKTFVQNLLLAKLRSQGMVALAVASSGIAATLLDGGVTAHSRFKIPVNGLSADSVCTIPKTGDLADLIRRTRLVFWDEAVMMHRWAVEAVDRTFRDVRSDGRPFGGLTICFLGDFRQTLPVIPRGLRGEVVAACLKRSYLWPDVVVLRLTTNERLRRDGLTAADRLSTGAFAEKLLRVGESNDPTGEFNWGAGDITAGNTLANLASTIFPGLGGCGAAAASYLVGRALLAVRNDAVDGLNGYLLNRAAGEAVELRGNDATISDGDSNRYPTEYLRSLDFPNMPPSTLRLKVHCPVMLLRNLNPQAGLCNGTRLYVLRIKQRILECEILSSRHAGAVVLIPKIHLYPHELNAYGVRFCRTQFPLRLAFAMTINKAQGQSFERVGLVLDPEVFSHGQLYVALSRVTQPEGVSLVVPNTERARSGVLRNVVYPEVLL